MPPAHPLYQTVAGLLASQEGDKEFSAVGVRYDVNANLVFKWLREGWLPADAAMEEAACFLPVEIVGKASPTEP